MKVGVVSAFRSYHHLCLVKLSSRHAHSAMSYGRWCLAFYSPILSLHEKKKHYAPPNVAKAIEATYIEVGNVSAFSSCIQLCLVKISS